MYLPVRLAASLPLAALFVAALAWMLATPEGRQVHPVYGFPNALLIAFLATVPGLLLVLPNVFAAIVANRVASGSVLAFAAIFCGLFLIGILAEAQFVAKLFRAPIGLEQLRDWRAIAVLIANCAMLLAVAAWYRRPAGL